MADRGFPKWCGNGGPWVVKVALAEKENRKRCWFHEDTTRRFQSGRQCWFPKKRKTKCCWFHEDTREKKLVSKVGDKAGPKQN